MSCILCIINNEHSVSHFDVTVLAKKKLSCHVLLNTIIINSMANSAIRCH